MSFAVGTFFFLLGLIFGSFLNVIIFRLNTGSGITGRSRCFSCGKTLSWYELIPLISYLIQKRRCRGCRSLISYQYPLVECVTGIVTIFVAGQVLVSPLSAATLFLFIVAETFFLLLIAISAYDARHKIIPNVLVYGTIGVSLVWFLFGVAHGTALPPDLLVGPLLFVFFWALWFFSRGRWMGFGDAKLSLSLGLFLGWPEGLSAMVFAFWVAAGVSILLLLFKGASFTLKSEVPLAPFLVLGAFVIFITHLDIVSFNYLFS